MKHDLQKNAHERDSDACKGSGDIPCVTKQRLQHEVKPQHGHQAERGPDHGKHP